MTLKYFTDPTLLARLDNSLFTQFLEDFTSCLPREALTLFSGQFNSPEEWWAAWAAQFSAPETLGPGLLSALIDIESLARPENSDILEDALSQLPPGFSINRQRSALYQAMYLRLIVKRRSDVTWPLPLHGAAPASPSTLNPQPSTSPAPPATDPQPATCNLQPSTDSVPETEAMTFSRLARLPATDYDRVRRSEAKRLNLRLKTLDEEVAAVRAQLQADAEAKGVDLPKLEPWPEPITDAPALFDEVSGRFIAHLFLPPGAADALTIWDALAHAFRAFRQSPRLNLMSAKGGCGKTTTLDVLATMCPRPLRTENMRAAVLFRVVDRYEPTLLLDELDSYLHESDELRGLLNAGHKFDGCAFRCEGPGNGFRRFKAFAPAAVAGIGELPATLRDRSILIPLVEAKPGDIPEPFNPDHAEIEQLLARKIARWAKDNFDTIKACKPKMPPGAHNRRADNWRPLFAIAQVIGGHWPDRILAAFNNLCPGAADGQVLRPLASVTQPSTLNPQLLHDIRQVFANSGATRLFSRQLVAALRAFPGQQAQSPPLTQQSLAIRLQGLGIRPHNIRIGKNRAKGYDLSDFADAFATLLKPPPGQT
jgi:putative DNA primase/helicase